MIQSEIREEGNSYVVTIPRVAMKLYRLHKGDTICFTPTRTESDYELDPELKALCDEIFTQFEPAFSYLAVRKCRVSSGVTSPARSVFCPR